MRRSMAIFLGLACWGFFTTSALAVVPPLIPVQGMLSDTDGHMLDGSYDLTFAIYESLATSTSLWSETQTGVSVDQGFFSVYLGDETALPIDVLVSAGELWLSMTVGGEELSRVQLASVPYALEAQVCRQLGDLEADEVQPVLSGAAACAPGQYLRGWDADAGAPLCSPDTTLDESTVEEFITDETINLHAGSTMNDLALSTGPHTTNLDWTAIDNKPTGLAIGSQACTGYDKMNGIDANGDIQCGEDLTLDETAVDTMVSNNGYAMNDIHCDAGVMTGISDLGEPECSWAYTGGALDMGTESITSLADPSASTDAANKQYVDQQVSETLVSPGVVASKDYFTVVISMSASGECPAGYDTHDMTQIAGPNSFAYINIMERGLFMGGLNSSGRVGEHIYAEIQTTQASKVCSRRYESGAGRPGISLLAVSGGSAGTCPSGYYYLPSSALSSDAVIRFYLNGNGAFLGPGNTAQTLAQVHNSDGGWQYRYWEAGVVDTFCYRVTGVEADSTTNKGVYPVVLGLDASATCPEGWNNASTNDLNGSDNNYVFVTQTNSSLVVGGASDRGYGGNNHLDLYFNSTYVDQVCWKEFAIVDSPYFTVKTPGTGSCPVGDFAFAASHVKSDNGNGFVAATGHALYIGGLYNWAYADQTEGAIGNQLTSQVTNQLCLNVHGAI